MSLPTEQHFKCDCVYPCEDYPHCGGHKITFSKPEQKETQEELETAHWVRIINDARVYDGSPHDMIKLIGHFKKLGYTITRKK